tara:strand:+ start:1232 stop:1666 length:435 start_codon:yes stop_codon:yes gene_type:complete
MSKILTVRGIGNAGDVDKILLFGGQQGNFSKAYRILSFTITPKDPMASNEISATINTIEVAHVVAWNWSKNTQIAWAAWGVPISTRFGIYSNVDEEAIVVEDLYIDFSGPIPSEINYELKLEQVDVSDFQAALSMVNARAQGSD